MKLIYKSALLLSFAILVISCAESTSEKRAEYDELFHQVLDIHDEVMPRMADIPQLSKKLEAKADTTTVSQQYVEAGKQLQEADKLMMGWMHSFSDELVKNKAEIEKMNNEQLQERIDALENELEEVREMKQEVNASIENAERLVE